MPRFTPRSVTVMEVETMIKALKNSHAFGHDNLDAATFKMGASILVPILVHLANLSLGTGELPVKWKVARIIPLLKGKDVDPLIPQSYCPVSQLPIASKLMEWALQVQLLKYLEETGQIANYNHTYRDKHSTTLALLQLMAIIGTGTDQNLSTATMSVDLSAAFDCIEHRMLLMKLAYYRFYDTTIKWITSYLEYRLAYVALGGAVSSINMTLHGVPQGSVLGQLLYLLYINKMTAVNKDNLCGDPHHQDTTKLFNEGCKDCGETMLFADDAVYVIASNNRGTNQERIKEFFWRVRDFLNANGLQLNETKTNLTEFMMKQKRARARGSLPSSWSVRLLRTGMEGSALRTNC